VDTPQRSATTNCALVTGASSGIGRALAVTLGARGMRVWLVGRDAPRLGAAERDVVAAGGEANVVRADLVRDGDLAAIVDAVTSQTDGLDVLVHAAGIAVADNGGAPTAEEIDAHHAVNASAPQRLTAGLRGLVEARHGMVVVINSAAGLRDAPGFEAYARSKHATRAWADTLRIELTGRGVRVCSIYPSQVASPMQEAIYAARGAAYEPDVLLQPDDLSLIVGLLLDHPELEVTDLSIRSARVS
jgi:NADP-dependent 3-hydroxy acid dehydrogenase YdfG